MNLNESEIIIFLKKIKNKKDYSYSYFKIQLRNEQSTHSF